MADEKSHANTEVPERVHATTQALLRLHEAVFTAPPTTLAVSDLLEWHAAVGGALGVRAGAWRTGEITFGSSYGFPPTKFDAADRLPPRTAQTRALGTAPGSRLTP